MGVSHPLGFGVGPEASFGMLPRVKNQIVMALELYSVANTPPPSLLKSAPKEQIDSGSSTVHPWLSLVAATSQSMVQTSPIIVALARLTPALVCSVMRLEDRLFTPSTMSISQATGQGDDVPKSQEVGHSPAPKGICSRSAMIRA